MRPSALPTPSTGVENESVRRETAEEKGKEEDEVAEKR